MGWLKKRVLNDMLESFKRDKENYIEPFLGSGVVMINVLNNNVETLHYKNIYVNDINGNIIDFYKMLKSKPKKLINDLIELSDKYNDMDNEDKEKCIMKLEIDSIILRKTNLYISTF